MSMQDYPSSNYTVNAAKFLKLLSKAKQKEPSTSGRFLNFQAVSLSHHRSKFVPVHQHAGLIAVLADAARYHLDRQAKLHGLAAQVSKPIAFLLR